MENSKKNIFLVEISGSHDECLYAQSLFYNKMGYDVYICASSNLKSRFDGYITCKKIFFFQFGNSRLKNFLILNEIKITFKKYNPEYIIFNTASNSIVMDLLLICGKKFKYAGIIHSLKKLKSSYTQNIINLFIKKYFVLNDYLLDYIPENVDKSKFESIYTVYVPTLNNKTEYEEDKFYICIPGHFEYKRRDYEFLLKLSSNPELNKKVIFVVLGGFAEKHSSGKDFIEKTEKLNLKDRFIFFENYVSTVDFQNYIKKSKLIMPLLHPETPFYEDYLNNQISGTFNLSFAYKVPMLIFEAFKIIPDLLENSFFYNFENSAEIINYLAENNSEIIEKSNKISSFEKFSIDYQIRKLKLFLNLQ